MKFIQHELTELKQKIGNSHIFIGLASLLWLLIKSGKKPSRLNYPCQKAAAANVSFFLLPVLLLYFHFFRNFFNNPGIKKTLTVLMTVIAVFSISIYSFQRLQLSRQEYQSKKRIQSGPIGKKTGGLAFAGGATLGTIPHALSLPSPHRVVAVHDSEATDWDFSCTGSGYCSKYYADTAYVDQDVVDKMIDTGLMRLTGAASVIKAWEQLLPAYLPGKKIAIKENFNDSIMGGGTRGYQDNDAYVDALPQILNSIIRGMKSFGVVENDIWVYDASRYITDRFRALVPYDNIHYFDRTGNSGDVELATFNSSVPSSTIDFSGTGYTGTHKICDIVVEADYLINIPIFKRHGGAGITLCMKNHLGTINGFLSGSHNMHNFFYLYASQYNSESNPIVNINTNLHIRDKTVLNIGDGLYGAWPSNNEVPRRWSSFNNDSPNMLFFSVDPVAVDSVMYDFLKRHGSFSSRSTDILAVAAETGLGVFESWSNDDERNYSAIDYHEIDMDIVRQLDVDNDQDIDGVDMADWIINQPAETDIANFANWFGTVL